MFRSEFHHPLLLLFPSFSHCTILFFLCPATDFSLFIHSNHKQSGVRYIPRDMDLMLQSSTATELIRSQLESLSTDNKFGSSNSMNSTRGFSTGNFYSRIGKFRKKEAIKRKDADREEGRFDSSVDRYSRIRFKPQNWDSWRA